MKKPFFVFILILPFVITGLASFSAEKKSSSVSLSVSNFSANDCSESDAQLFSEMISSQLYSSRLFELYDRSQMQLVLQKEFETSHPDNDLYYASRLGRMLNVEKIIIGSVSYSGKYIITVTSVNVKDSLVDCSFSVEASSRREFLNAAKIICGQIIAYYFSTGKVAYRSRIQASFSMMKCSEGFTTGSAKGYGGDLAFLHMLDSFNFSAGVRSGFWFFVSPDDSVKSLSVIPLLVCGERFFCFADGLFLSCRIGAGYFFSQLFYDPVKNRPAKKYSYESKFLFHPGGEVRVNLDCLPFPHLALSVGFFSSALLEKREVLRIYGLAFSGAINY